MFWIPEEGFCPSGYYFLKIIRCNMTIEQIISVITAIGMQNIVELKKSILQ